MDQILADAAADVERIVNGDATTKSEYPYIAAIIMGCDVRQHRGPRGALFRGDSGAQM